MFSAILLFYPSFLHILFSTNYSEKPLASGFSLNKMNFHTNAGNTTATGTQRSFLRVPLF
jgi:hypothetical protein